MERQTGSQMGTGIVQQISYQLSHALAAVVYAGRDLAVPIVDVLRQQDNLGTLNCRAEWITKIMSQYCQKEISRLIK